MNINQQGNIFYLTVSYTWNFVTITYNLTSKFRILWVIFRVMNRVLPTEDNQQEQTQ